MTLDGNTVKPDPSKVEVDGLATWPRTLPGVHEVCKVLGMLGYQRQFIPGFVKLTKPLTQLLKKGVPFEWTEECTKALDAHISMVTKEPVLVHPIPGQPFYLVVDASYYATGAILMQDQEGK
jgi:hypothetical protein